MSLPPHVVLMAEAAAGRLSRRDLTRAGVPPSTADDWVRRGLLERTDRGELRIVGSDDTLRQRLAGALWRAGSGARLSGAVVCSLRGLKGFEQLDEDELDHVAISPHRRVTGVSFKVVRTPIAEIDQDEILGLPAVTVERGLIAAAATFRPARIRVAADDAVFKRLTTYDKLRERACALGKVPGAAAVRRAFNSGVFAMESEPERGLFSIFRPGDPKPAQQVWICWHGKWFRMDFAYLAARLDLEYDGDDHERTRERDADRDLALAELDIQSLRITKSMMRDPDATRRRVLAVYRGRLALALPPIVPDTPPWLGSRREGPGSPAVLSANRCRR